MPLTKIQSLGITDGTIVNADISASAAIATSKLSGGTNTPAFYAYASSKTNLSNASATKITLDAESFDTDSAFASNRFTVPSGKDGKYFFAAGIREDSFTANRFILQLQKNASSVVAQMELSGGVSGYMTAVVSTVLNLSSSDYIEMFCYQDSGVTKTNSNGIADTWLTGFKLIE